MQASGNRSRSPSITLQRSGFAPVVLRVSPRQAGHSPDAFGMTVA
jgi:hypothetical protein